MHRRILLIVIACAALAATAAGQAKADGPNFSQPISVSWTTGFAPPAFYQYGQKLTYRFTITNNSDQLHFASVFLEDYVIPQKVGPAQMRHLSYKLKPHQKINVLYQTYAPDGAVFADSTFGVSAEVQPEGYPEVWLGAYAWHDNGK